jgi:TatD DNase family protein
LPLDRILVETDSPYLAPVPMRGKKCEPAFIRYTAEKIAELKGLPMEEVARATTANARKAFRIPAY